MDYLKIYNQLIARAKEEKRQKGSGVYYESHHIIPRSEGGSNNKNNLVLLTAREHYIAHALLYMNNPSTSRAYAYWRMANHFGGKITSRLYEEVRIKTSKLSSIREKSRPPHSEEHKARLSRSGTKRQKNPTESQITARKYLRDKCGIKVLQVDQDDNIVNMYDSIRQARIKTSISQIGRCLLGHQKTAGGFSWKYDK